MATVYANCDSAFARHVETRKAIRREARKGTRKSKERLAAARASSTHQKISGPDHMTRVLDVHDGANSWIVLEATDPMAIEFGHFPSGFFAPAKFGRMTMAPQGLYIITVGSGYGLGSHSISSGQVRGNR